MNIVVLMGRLTKDPDVRYSQGDNSLAIARYTLAVDRRRGRSSSQGDQQTADFISCVAFGKSAEFAEKYLHKGTKICIRGRIQTGSYTNKDGVKVYTTDVVIDDQEFAESKNAQTSGPDYSSYANAGRSQSSAPAPEKEESPSGAVEGFMNIPEGIDEELPFN
jgi:single-strand DNA-binding protein